jgi:hypothetical protein
VKFAGMCQKVGNWEVSHDRSDAGCCRNLNTNGNNLNGVVADVYLKSHEGYSCACRGILVLLRLEADTECDSPGTTTECAPYG